MTIRIELRREEWEAIIKLLDESGDGYYADELSRQINRIDRLRAALTGKGESA